tara:strand:- start:1342 stop:1470 length:129 start_codon:yes stop_codon:yes gene_type:complete
MNDDDEAFEGRMQTLVKERYIKGGRRGYISRGFTTRYRAAAK